MIFRNIVYISLLSTLFFGCKTTSKLSSTESISLNSDTLSSDKMFDFRYVFFEATKAQFSGNFDLAILYYNDALKINPNSASTYFQLASIYTTKSDYVTAEKYAVLAVDIDNENVWYQYLLANLYAKNKKSELAIKSYLTLIKLDEKQMDFYLSLADAYIQNNEFNQALKVYDQVNNKFGVNEIIIQQKVKILLAQNKKNEAANEFLKFVQLNGNTPYFQRLLADFYLEINEIDKALQIYNEVVKLDSTDGFAFLGLAECYRIKSDFERSFYNLKIAFLSSNMESDVKINLLVSLVQNAGNNEKLQNEISELILILYNLYPDNSDVATFYADVLLKSQNFEEARKVLRTVISVRKDKYVLWEQLILLENEFQDWPNMFSESSEALQYFPNQSFLYFFNGFSAFQLEKYNEAIKSLEFGIQIITKEDPLRNDFYTFLGESYHKVGNKEKAYKIFDELLLTGPDNIMVLNNYAYYLSVDNVNLQKAELMSRKTILKEPTNPTYLDTYAWILFKQKNYSKALEYIKKAIENSSVQSDVVVEHYGDILFFNQMVDDAIIQWIKAKELGEGSGLLQKKIDEKNYSE